MSSWTASDIPTQRGRLAIVTGTGGLGFEDALALARAHASVIVAGRNPTNGDEARRRILAEVPTADIRFETLDLASLASIQRFGDRIKSQYKELHVLINNAGVMMPPRRKTTEDGFELQFGTNYLGHFALTAHLLPLLRRTKNARVVTVSSIADRSGAILFDDLQWERHYKPMGAYCQSKLACLIFALELQRRCDANDWAFSSMAAHPGLAHTKILTNGGGRFGPMSLWFAMTGWLTMQSAARGALPTLFAATSPDALSGHYYGPDGFMGFKGAPTEANITMAAKDLTTASRLWEISERLTNLSFGANK